MWPVPKRNEGPRLLIFLKSESRKVLVPYTEFIPQNFKAN